MKSIKYSSICYYSGVPVVQSTADNSAGQKRAREDETNGDHPAKKVDAKE